jgi:hypothetical protein
MGMTSRTSRVFIAALATTLVVGAMGCGLINKAQQVVGTAKILSDFGDRLQNGEKLTYTATYDVVDGTPVTLTQQPPNSAYVGKSGRFIFTPTAMYLCDTENGVLTCQKSTPSGTSVDASDAGLVSGVAGDAFVSPALALGLIASAILVPGAKVSESNKTIAGQSSRCATASNLDAAASPGDTSAPRDFTVCVTDGGALASFTGTDTSGKKLGMTMTSYSTTVDTKSFQPPSGAKIVDVDQIEPSPSN